MPLCQVLPGFPGVFPLIMFVFPPESHCREKGFDNDHDNDRDNDGRRMKLSIIVPIVVPIVVGPYRVWLRSPLDCSTAIPPLIPEAPKNKSKWRPMSPPL